MVIGRVRQDHIAENRRFRGRTVERGSPFDGRARIGKRDFLTHASSLPGDAAIVGDIHADAGARREGAENTVHINGVDSAGNRRRLTHDHLRGHRGGAHVEVSAVAVGVDLARALVAVAGARPVAREHDLVVVGVNDAVVAATRHHALALAGKQTAGHGVVEVLALVVRVHVVDVVHDVGHADGKTCPMVVVIRRGGHEPCPGDHGWRRGIDLLQVVVLGGGVVHADVHLAGVVVEVNPRDVVGVLVVVGILAHPLHLRTCRVPTNLPLVHHVVRVVSRVDVPVVDISVVNTSCGRTSTRTGAVGRRAQVGTRAGVDSHDARGGVGNVLAGIADDVNFGVVDGNSHTRVAPRCVAGRRKICEFLGWAGVALIAQGHELTGGVEVGVAEGGDRV